MTANFCELYSQEKSSQASKRIHPALIVIDVQNAFLPAIPEQEKNIGFYYINHYIELFRKYNFPVIRVYHTTPGEGPVEGTEPFEFPPAIKILQTDAKVVKNYPDAFNKTDLNKILKEKNVNTVFLVGFSATGCVISTFVGAMDYDYQPFLIKDAIMSPNSTYTDNIEEIFEAIGSSAVQLLIENSEKQ